MLVNPHASHVRRIGRAVCGVDLELPRLPSTGDSAHAQRDDESAIPGAADEQSVARGHCHVVPNTPTSAPCTGNDVR